MKHLRSVWCLLVASVFALAGCAGGGGGDGWITLLDGSDPRALDNWERSGDFANWRVIDGVVQADKGGKGTSHLVSRDSYSDFELRAEFWAEATTNSGIFIRIQNPKDVTAKNAYEVNIFDTSPNAGFGTGSIVGFAKVEPMLTAAGKWNTYHVTAKGPTITVRLNGAHTVTLKDSSFSSGPISLQFGNGPKGAPGGTIKWRKVEIRPL